MLTIIETFKTYTRIITYKIVNHFPFKLTFNILYALLKICIEINFQKQC